MVEKEDRPGIWLQELVSMSEKERKRFAEPVEKKKEQRKTEVGHVGKDCERDEEKEKEERETTDENER